MVSCRSPVFPKIVTFTFSSKLAPWSLKSVDFEASTVKILRGPSIFEKVRPLDCFSTFTGAAGGASLRSLILCQPRLRYTPPVKQASGSATAADQRAYRAASLVRIVSVKQNSQGLYRRGRDAERDKVYPAVSAEAAAVVSGKIPMFAAATLSRFVFFTRYMASSARCKRPSLVRESVG